ncbi:MAG: universal stress protein [Chloroflexota bacterium]|nr:universal stress protein [Chloroflexota bacterium]
MERHILVPLDGSSLAELALTHALCIARTTSQGITLLRTIPLHPVASWGGRSPVTSGGYEEIWEDEREAAHDYLRGLAERLKIAGIAAQIETSQDDAASAIVSYPEEHAEASLVVMTTHGHSGVNRWVFGSVTEKVLHASPVPLLLVRPLDDHRLQALITPEYKLILVPLDGSPLAEQALEEARVLAVATGAELVLVCAVNEFPEIRVARGSRDEITRWQGEAAQIVAYLDATAEVLRADGLTVRTKIEYGAPADAILHASEMTGADLIVMSNHGRSGLHRPWLGSVALKVVQGAPWPVLLVCAKEHT